ncbi:MAG: trypsin-like peptidase domain-containing protein [bacterium]
MKKTKRFSHTFTCTLIHTFLTIFITFSSHLFSATPEETRNNTLDININALTGHTTQETAQKAQEPKKSWSEICEQKKDAVVQIFAYGCQYNLFEPFKMPENFSSTGTGFFINNDGDILTAYHVVAQSVSLEIQIPSLGKERFPVIFIGGCPHKDVAKLRLADEVLALIKQKFNTQELKYLELGDSDTLLEAQKIMALGFPLGDEEIKISVGDVSGRKTTTLGESIQTTAPINPGNSGGPCLNKQGKVIGICSSKKVGEEIEGVAYLIPIKNIFPIMDQLCNKALIKKPYWGLEILPTTADTLEFLGNPIDGGIYIKKVEKGSLAEEYKIKKSDVLYKINDKQIDKYGDIDSPWGTGKVNAHDYLARLPLGSVVTYTLYRQGKKIEISGEIKNPDQYKIKHIYPWIDAPLEYEIIGGMVIVELTLNHIDILKNTPYNFSLIKKYADDENRLKPRLMISTIYPSSPFHNTRCFRDGDWIIKKVNGIKVYTIQEFRQAVLDGATNKSLTVETTGGSFAAVKISDIISKEDELSHIYFYPKSELVSQLAERSTKDTKELENMPI